LVAKTKQIKKSRKNGLLKNKAVIAAKALDLRLMKACATRYKFLD
jgi:hypothetical protein